MVHTFNKHFINTGIATQLNLPANPVVSTGSILNSSNPSLISFNFRSISASEVQKALLGLDCKRPPGPDQIEPYFLKTVANLIAGPISSIFNLSLHSGSILKSWKSALVFSLLKSGSPSVSDSYHPISRLAKLFHSG